MPSHSPAPTSAQFGHDPAPDITQWTSRLPFDIIHYLLGFASVADVVRLCSTCRPLHQHTGNGAIWKRACTQYGLHCDADFLHFNSASPFTVYTQLLYPYGPLIGLWASNYPLLGGILEFRLYKGDEREQGGIIGEVWSFPQSESIPTGPILPTYARVIKIALEHEPLQPDEDPGATISEARPARVHASLFCDAGPDAADPTAHHPASLVRLHASRLRHHLRFYRRGVDAPFPDPDRMRWLDDPAARLPHVRAVPDPALKGAPRDGQRKLVDIYPAARLPVLCEFLDDRDGPPAISFTCSRTAAAARRPDPPCPCVALRAPPLLIPSVHGLSAPRYFPLRAAPDVGGAGLVRDPAAPGWTPDALEGLWVGAAGAHGTEVVHVARVRSALGVPGPFGEFAATKLAGDTLVSRGAFSWQLLVPEAGGCVKDRQDRAAMRSAWQARRGAVPPRLFWGVGSHADYDDVCARAVFPGRGRR